MTSETLFSSYQPIDQYLRLLHADRHRVVRAAISIQAVDAFLMKQLAAYYPVKPTIIDLAAESTLGASPVFWLAHPAVQQVIVPYDDNTNPDWLAWLQDAKKSMALDNELLILPQAKADLSSRWRDVETHLNSLSPSIIVLAVPEIWTGGVKSILETLLTRVPEPLIFLFPIGAIGRSTLLDVALSICAPNSPYQLTAMRDISFFFANSQLGLIYKRDNHIIPDILSRMWQLYEGNFDLLSLLENNIGWQVANQSEKVAQIQQETVPLVPPPYPEPLLSGRLIQRGYRALVPSGLRKNLWDVSVSMTTGVRDNYHKVIPLKTRLVLRDIRILLLGR
ncbi:MAG: hypothetical protein KDJ52_03970 [Anaerolineae bacterium]|nr:hypothetical protein [Anaerolineae bacterium]